MRAIARSLPLAAVLVALGCTSQVDNTDSTSTSALATTCNSVGQSALAYEASKLALGDYFSDDCLGFVQLAFHRVESYLADPGCSGTAADSLACARKATGWTAWDGSCPCGAILYWAGNSCNGEDGHVVICNGDGTASTSGWPTSNGGHYGGSTHASISWLDGEECGHEPAGYIVPGGAPPPPPSLSACVAGGVADFNGDGKSDVLVRGVSGWDTTPVFFSNGDGSLTFSNDADPTKTIFNAAGSQAFVGDFDGDGKTDVLVKGVSGWDTTPVFFSNGNGTFRFSNALDPTKSLFNLAGADTLLGDFNGDGKTDVIIRGVPGWDTTLVFFSNGDGTFRYSNAADPTKTVFNAQGAQALVGDVNGDGKADVILKNGAGWYTTPVFLSNGDGTFTYHGGDDPAKAVFNDASAQAFIGDFNHDGKADVLVRGVSGWDTTPVYLSNGDGTFTFSNAADTTKNLFNLPIAQAFVGDFDGDGKTDVLVKGVSGWDTTPVFFSNGDGTFRFSNAADPSKTIFNFLGAETLLGDFNGDGKTDVLLKNGTGWTTTPLFLSKGDGTFSYADDSNSAGAIFNFAGAASLCY
jgi:hypothetical protein